MSAFLPALGAWLQSLFSTPKKAPGPTGVEAILAATAGFVGPWEGERTEAYLVASHLRLRGLSFMERRVA